MSALRTVAQHPRRWRPVYPDARLPDALYAWVGLLAVPGGTVLAALMTVPVLAVAGATGRAVSAAPLA
ncbi:hypothetical protein [uncultured Deinococcus sp.]|uniref:hypothetical protein n=1 Tax=uncultured Deinococcus sp. TaxID=158789 RepID=UPI0025D8BD64|nr:hypothetical protein [uncultured Deinococcus sp.]